MSLDRTVVDAVEVLAGIVSDLAVPATIARQSPPVYDVSTGVNSSTTVNLPVKVFQGDNRLTDTSGLRLKSEADFLALAAHNPGVTFYAGEYITVSGQSFLIERVNTVPVASSIMLFELFVKN